MAVVQQWQPMIGDEVISGWQVYAKTEAAARLMVEERMHRRAYFSLCREWKAQGSKVVQVKE